MDDLLAQLIETLDDELVQMTVLRQRLVVLASLTAADQAPWLPMSVRELERTVEDLRLLDLRRAVTTIGITEACCLDPDATLEEIAGRVKGHWSEVLHDRRRAFLDQIIDLHTIGKRTRAALGRRSELVEEALDSLAKGVGATYTPRPAGGARVVEGAL